MAAGLCTGKKPTAHMKKCPEAGHEMGSIEIEAGIVCFTAGPELKVEVSLLLAVGLLDEADGLAGCHRIPPGPPGRW